MRTRSLHLFVSLAAPLVIAGLLQGCAGDRGAPEVKSIPRAPADLLADWIDGDRPPWLRSPDFERDVEVVRELYDARSWQLAWFDAGMPTSQALDLSRILGAAADRGLRPSDYQAAAWRSRWAAVALGDIYARAHLDLAFTAAVTDFVRDLRFGRVDPRLLGIETGDVQDAGTLAAILARVRSAPNVEQTLRELAEPQHPAYHHLLRVLQGLRTGDEPGQRAQIPQVELALERWRWLPRNGAGPVILVNVPEFRLRAYGPSGEAELEMNVVVGNALRSATPLLSEQVRTVVFHPQWYVPESIVRNELVPSEERAPGYLAANDYEILDQAGQPWSGPVTAALLAGLREGWGGVRQRAGPGNALGRVKFLFPNQHDVYMHDTPARAAFSRERRDLSHGCVRVADPEALASWALRGVPGWDDRRVAAAMAGAETMAVTLPRPIRVVFVYHTTVVEQDALRFLPDVYGYDAALRQAMAEGELPAANAAGVDVHEVRAAVEADTATLQGERGVA